MTTCASSTTCPSASATPRALGSAAPTRTSMGSCASTSPRARTSASTAPANSRPSPWLSTAGPAKPRDGARPPKPWTPISSPPKVPMLRRPAETALAGAHVGQIAEPHRVRGRRLEAAPDRVGRDRAVVPAVGGAHPARQGRQAPQPGAPHRPGHPVAADPAADGAQRSMDARRAPYGPPLSAWTTPMVSSRARSARLLALPGRDRRAWSPLTDTPSTRPRMEIGQTPLCSSTNPNPTGRPPRRRARPSSECRAPCGPDPARASAGRARPPARPARGRMRPPSRAAARAPPRARRNAGSSVPAPSHGARARSPPR